MKCKHLYFSNQLMNCINSFKKIITKSPIYGLVFIQSNPVKKLLRIKKQLMKRFVLDGSMAFVKTLMKTVMLFDLHLEKKEVSVVM